LVQAIDASAAPDDALRSRRIGPYLIVEYRPQIDYERWQYAVVLGEDHEHAPAQAWKPAALPAADVAVALGDTRAVVWSGRLRRPLAGADTRIAVSVVSDAPLEVVGVRIDGSRVPRLTTRVQQTPLMLRRPPGWLMGAGWTSESVFELKGSLTPGGERLLIAVAGTGQLLGFDVYEGGASPAAADQTIISSPGRLRWP
jgi:hypothetical protein